MPILTPVGHYDSNFPYCEIRKFHDDMWWKVFLLSNIIKFIFLIILFGKISSSKSLSSSGFESETKRMCDFEKFILSPYSLELTKSEVPVAYGRNSVSHLTSSNDVATNGVNGRISNKSWCKCECCSNGNKHRKCLLPRNSLDL